MTELTDDRIRVAFVCVKNAGRSQMAYAFAERELAERGLEDAIELSTGGTRPAEHVHDEVVRALDAVGIDVGDRTPSEISFEALRASDFVVTMGCSAEDVCPAGWAGESRDWDLDDPDGKAPREVERIRDEIEARVRELVDEFAETS